MGGNEEDGGESRAHATESQSQQQQEAKGGKNSSCHWTPEEDKILLNHVMRYGSRYWGLLQATGQLPQRDQKSCCNRFLLLKKRCLGTTSAVVVDASHAAASAAAAASQPAEEKPAAPPSSPPAPQSAPKASPATSAPSLTATAAAGASGAVGTAALPTAPRIQPSAPRAGPASTSPVLLGSSAAAAPTASPSLSPSTSTLPVSPSQPFAQSALAPSAPLSTARTNDQRAPAGDDTVASGKVVPLSVVPANAGAARGEFASAAHVRVKAEDEQASEAGGTTADAAAATGGIRGTLAGSSGACGGADALKKEQSNTDGEESKAGACEGDEAASVGGGNTGPASTAGAAGGGIAGDGGGRTAPVILTSVTPDLMSAAAPVAAVPLPSVVATPSERKRNNKVVACRIALLLQQAPPRPANTAAASPSPSATGAPDSPPSLTLPSPAPKFVAPAGPVSCASTATGAGAPGLPAAAPSAPAPGANTGAVYSARPVGSPAVNAPATGGASYGGKGVKIESADVGTSGSTARYYYAGQQQQSPAFHPCHPAGPLQASQQQAAAAAAAVVAVPAAPRAQAAGQAAAPSLTAGARLVFPAGGGAEISGRSASVCATRTPTLAPTPPPAFPSPSPDHLARCHSEPCVANPRAAPSFLLQQPRRPSPATSLPASISGHPSRCMASATGARQTAASAENSTPPGTHMISPSAHPPATPTFLPAGCPSATHALSPLILSPAAVPLDDPPPAFSCAMHPPSSVSGHPLSPPLPHCAEHVPAGHPWCAHRRRPRRLTFAGSPAVCGGGGGGPPAASPANAVDADVIVEAVSGGVAVTRKRQACSSSSSGGSGVDGRRDGGNDAGSNSCSSRRDGAGTADRTDAAGGTIGGTILAGTEEEGRADGGEALGDAGRSGSSSDQVGGEGEEGEWERGDEKRHAIATPLGSPSRALPLTPSTNVLPPAPALAPAHMALLSAALPAPASPAVAGSATGSPCCSRSGFRAGVQYRTRCAHAHACAHGTVGLAPSAKPSSPALAPAPPLPAVSPAAAAAAAAGSVRANPPLGLSRSLPAIPTSAPHTPIHKSTSASSFLASMRCLLPIGPTTSHRWFGPAVETAANTTAAAAAAAEEEDGATFCLSSPLLQLFASARLRPRAAPPPPLFLSASSSATSLQALVEEAFPAGLRPALLSAAAAPTAIAAAAGVGAAEDAAAVGVEASCEPMSGEEEEAEQERLVARALLRVLEQWPHVHAIYSQGAVVEGEEEDGEGGEGASALAAAVNTLSPATVLTATGTGAAASAFVPSAAARSPLLRPIPPAFSVLPQRPPTGAADPTVAAACAPAPAAPAAAASAPDNTAGRALQCGSPVAAAGEACEASDAGMRAQGSDGEACMGGSEGRASGTAGDTAGGAGGGGQSEEKREEKDCLLEGAGAVKDGDSLGESGCDQAAEGLQVVASSKRATRVADCGIADEGGDQAGTAGQVQQQGGVHGSALPHAQVTGQKRVSPVPLDLPAAKRLTVVGHTQGGSAAAVVPVGVSSETASAVAAQSTGVIATAADAGSARLGFGWVMGEESEDERVRAVKQAVLSTHPRSSPSPSASRLTLPTAVPLLQHPSRTSPVPAAAPATATPESLVPTCTNSAASGEAADAAAGSDGTKGGGCGSSSSSSSSSGEAGSGLSASLMEYLRTVDDLPGASVPLLDKHSDSEGEADGAHDGGTDGGKMVVDGWQGSEEEAPGSPALAAAVVTADKQAAAAVDVAGMRVVGVCNAAGSMAAGTAGGGGPGGVMVERSRVCVAMGGCCLDTDAAVATIGGAGVSPCPSGVGF